MKCDAPRIACVLVALSLTSCSAASERREKALQTFGDVRDTASGAVTEVQTELKEATTVVSDFAEEVLRALAEVERRWALLREGVGKIEEGQEMIRESL